MKMILIILGLLGLFSSGVCLAADPSPNVFKGIEILTGFGRSQLEGKSDYHLHTVTFDFNFDLKPFLKTLGLCPEGLFLFQIEPFAGWVSQPEINTEIGNAFMFKWGISPEWCPIQPYVKAGLGILYMSQTTREQSTQFNFLEQAGLGIHYFITKDIAFTAESLYRHISNGGFKEPNGGINTLFLSLGISKNF
jgi:lipid A 3-O-deacylase